jgi:hypothetical protein
MSHEGHELPRHLTECATALPHKAATPTVRYYRGSYGPLADVSKCSIRGGIILVHRHQTTSFVVRMLPSTANGSSERPWVSVRSADETPTRNDC